MGTLLVIIGCISLGLFIIAYTNGGVGGSSRLQGGVTVARGEVFLLGIYSFEVASIVLHSDKIMINNRETISLGRVKYARAYQYLEPVHSKTSVTRAQYRLIVHFTGMDGFESKVECRSKSSFGFGGYEGFANEVNKRINYTPPSSPKEPYEI
jgi:hypothetical protein